MRQLHGKELSFNNLLDLSAARELAEEFAEPTCAIVKHNNPCGCALGESGQSAYERAFACDPQSAYGGVIAINRPIDRPCAEALSGQFIEVLFAPGFNPEALELLQGKKNVRLLECPRMGDLPFAAHATEDRPAATHATPQPKPPLEGKPVIGGLLVQDRDIITETREQMRPLSILAPSEEQWESMLFAWRICRHVRSNAIVIAAGRATIGIGAGQMSGSTPSVSRLRRPRTPSPHYSPARCSPPTPIFPFADGPELAMQAGVSAIIQPGGSVRDPDVIAAVDAAGVAMVATDVRHFRH